MKVMLVVNPNAGRKTILRSLGRVVQVFAERGDLVTVAQTQGPEQAAQIIKEAVAEKPDLLICCGGDGTLSDTVSHILETGAKVSLGYIPTGTTNDFASSLKIFREPVKAARQIADGTPRPLDVGRFEERGFIYVASFGAFTQSSYNTTQSLKNSLGHLAYVIEGIKELPVLKSYEVRVETAEGGVYEGEYLFGSMSNSTSFGGIVKLDPHTVDFSDGKFELTLVKTPKNLSELNRVLGSLMSGKFDKEMITFVQTERAVFTCAQPMPWSLDGEYAAGDDQVEIKAMPRAIELYY